MPSLSRSSVVIDIDPEASPFPREVDEDTPFRILVLGDFSGRQNRGVHAPLAGRHPVLADLDNFGEVMTQLAPALHLPAGEFRFRELDDFHPDRLYRYVRQEPPKSAPPAKAVAAGPDLLDSILSDAEPTPAPADEQAGDLSAFIRRSMASSLVARPDPAQQASQQHAAALTSDQMRALLHHPHFQSLEAAWRAAWMLIQGLGDDVKVYLLDATLDELIADKGSLDSAVASSRDGWALIVGNYSFGESAEDAARLTQLGRLAQRTGAPFLAEAQPPSDDPSPEWQALRTSPLARAIGLILPRFLLRLPYGKTTDAVETFEFEEMKGSDHQSYLWGNPAFCCALLLGQSFVSEGWDLRPGTHRKVEGLPLHVYRQDGESVNKPCAEVLLNEKQAEFLMERGYMPLASLKDQDAVLLVRFQSIADPLAALAGRWS